MKAALELSRWRRAVFLLFVSTGFALASLFTQIPTIRDDLNAPISEVGLIALSLSIGSITGLTVASVAIKHLGSRLSSLFSLTIASVGLILTGFGSTAVQDILLVKLGFVVFGIGFGICNVTMNVEAAALEQRRRLSLMPFFHASYSIGGIGGSALGIASVSFSINVLIVSIVVVSTISVPVLFIRYLRPRVLVSRGQSDPGHGPRRIRQWLDRRTVIVGLLIFSTSYAAGSANNWLILAMIDGHGVGKEIANVSYSLYVLAVTVGRLCGIAALNRWGRVKSLRGSALLTLLGVLAVLLGPAWVAVCGALLWGLGTALGFPIAISAVSDDPVYASQRISAVSTIGYGASLVAPTIIGFIAEHTSLLTALATVLIMSVMAGATASATREQHRD